MFRSDNFRISSGSAPKPSNQLELMKWTISIFRFVQKRREIHTFADAWGHRSAVPTTTTANGKNWKWKINICENAFAMSTLNSSFNTQQYIYCFYFRCVHSFAFTLLRRSNDFDGMAFLHCVLTIRPVTVSIDLFSTSMPSLSIHTMRERVSAQLTIRFFFFAFCSISFDGVRVASSHEHDENSNI